VFYSDCSYLKTLTDVIAPDSDYVEFTTDLGKNKTNPLVVDLGLVKWQVGICILFFRILFANLIRTWLNFC